MSFSLLQNMKDMYFHREDYNEKINEVLKGYMHRLFYHSEMDQQDIKDKCKNVNSPAKRLRKNPTAAPILESIPHGDIFLSLLASSHKEINPDDSDEVVDIAKCLEQKVEVEIRSYQVYCEEVKMEHLLELCGTQKYFKSREKLDKDESFHLAVKLRDANNLRQYFDVLKFWKLIGSQRWPRLSTLAILLLVKPSHNGFQERVFSKGRYKDGWLQKRQHKDSNEISVLEAVNEAFMLNKDFFQTLKDVEKTDRKENKQVINKFFERNTDDDHTDIAELSLLLNENNYVRAGSDDDSTVSFNSTNSTDASVEDMRNRLNRLEDGLSSDDESCKESCESEPDSDDE